MVSTSRVKITDAPWGPDIWIKRMHTPWHLSKVTDSRTPLDICNVYHSNPIANKSPNRKPFYPIFLGEISKLPCRGFRYFILNMRGVRAIYWAQSQTWIWHGFCCFPFFSVAFYYKITHTLVHLLIIHKCSYIKLHLHWDHFSCFQLSKSIIILILICLTNKIQVWRRTVRHIT